MRPMAPAPRAIDAIGELPFKAIDAVFDKKYGAAMGIIVDILYVLYHQSILDVSKCIPDLWGGGASMIGTLRGLCNRFSAVVSPMHPTIWQRATAHTTKDTAPVAFVMNIQKCNGISKQTWDGAKLPVLSGGKFCQHKTADGGKTATTCLTKCDDGFAPMCRARVTWIYNQCSTCCCKGGAGYKIEINSETVNSDDDEIGETEKLGSKSTSKYARDKEKCALWFQTIEVFTTGIFNAMSKLDSILMWGGRCMKF